MCKKQTSVSPNSTESEVFSLHAGLRRDGMCSRSWSTGFGSWIWLLKYCILPKTYQFWWDPWRDEAQRKHANTRTKQHIHRYDVELFNVDHVTAPVKSSHFGALLYICEDDEAVIKMIIRGRSPTVRHVSRTHRVALDWLFDRINLEFKK